MSIKDAQLARTEKYLSSLIRYNGKVITVKEWLHALKNEGWTPCIDIVHDAPKEVKERERLRLLLNSWDYPIGNPNHPRTIKYHEDKAELEKGIFKTIYAMSRGNFSHVINKTAYDYILAQTEVQSNDTK